MRRRLHELLLASLMLLGSLVLLLAARTALAQGPRAAGRDTVQRPSEQRPVATPTPDAPPRTVEVRITERGFEPAEVTFKKGERARLVFTRSTDATCAKVLVIDHLLVWSALPLNERFATTFTAGRAGEFPYTCPTREIQGVIKVEE